MAEIDEIHMLCDFLDEILIPLGLLGTKIAQTVEDWGFEVIDEEFWDDWRVLFKVEEK